MVQTSHHDEFGVESVEQFVEHAPIRIQRLVPDGTVLQANQALLGSRLLDLGYTVLSACDGPTRRCTSTRATRELEPAQHVGRATCRREGCAAFSAAEGFSFTGL